MRAAMAMLLVGFTMTAAAAQTAAPAPEPYRPGLGDLMTMTIQPRHMKLLLAGNAQNWIYAKYELHELQEAFDRAVRVWPRYKGLPLAGMIDAIAKGPMDELAKAIDGKDEIAFDAAYEKLTEGCNACHQAANVGQVVIKIPNASTFPDQDFRPQKSEGRAATPTK
jgi:hypothetical protein